MEVEEEEEEVEEEVEAMVLGDLMRTPGGGGFPKQLAAISTDPIKINERAACESKPLRRSGCCPVSVSPSTKTSLPLRRSDSFSRTADPCRGSD